MGQALGVSVVAEGVETRAQADELKALGCGLAQGYLFARPLTPQAAAELLKKSYVSGHGATRRPAER